MTETQSRKYVHWFQDLVESYNNRPHRSLQFLTPNDADKVENQDRVSSIHRERYAKLLDRKTPIRFKVGDQVRVKVNYDQPFARSYNEQFSQALYEIIGINRRMPIPMYKLKHLESGEDVMGGWYAQELTLVQNPDNVFKVEKVLKKRRRRGIDEILVKWANYSDSHNSWIPASNVTQVFDNV